MRVKVLGAHMFESSRTKLSCVVVDGVLAVDAGSLTSGLTFKEQGAIQSIILTHGHYDHIRDVPAFALRHQHRTTDVYTTAATLGILTSHFINGQVYPDFTTYPSPDKPALKLHAIEPLKPFSIGEYRITAVQVPHAVPSVGYEVADASGGSLFFSGDTGPGLGSCWEHINPQLVIIDMAFSNRSAEIAPRPGHLCPSLFARELADFREQKGYLPRVVMTHLNPEIEAEVAEEARALARDMQADIALAREGMLLEL